MTKKSEPNIDAAFMTILGLDKEPAEEPVTAPAETGVGDPVPAEPVEQEECAPEAADAEVAADDEKVEQKRKGRPKLQRETKKRYTITILPSIYEKASEIAYKNETNMSELISDFLTSYVKKHSK